MEPRTEEDEFYSTPEEFYEDLKNQIARRDMKFNIEIYYKDEKIRLMEKQTGQLQQQIEQLKQHIKQLETHIEKSNAVHSAQLEKSNAQYEKSNAQFYTLLDILDKQINNQKDN